MTSEILYLKSVCSQGVYCHWVPEEEFSLEPVSEEEESLAAVVGKAVAQEWGEQVQGYWVIVAVA